MLAAADRDNPKMELRTVRQNIPVPFVWANMKKKKQCYACLVNMFTIMTALARGAPTIHDALSVILIWNR